MFFPKNYFIVMFFPFTKINSVSYDNDQELIMFHWLFSAETVGFFLIEFVYVSKSDTFRFCGVKKVNYFVLMSTWTINLYATRFK